MKFLLTPEGIRNDKITEALTNLLGKPISNSNILFIPTPANLRVDDKSWIVENMNQFLRLSPASFDIVDIAGMPTPQISEHLEVADVVCFGGGDDSYISEVIHSQNLVDILYDSLQSCVFVGISAGSMMVGTSLPPGFNKKLYPDEPFIKEQADTFGWCDVTFIPHLNSDECPEVRIETLEALSGALPENTIALSDESALIVDDKEISIVGEGDVWKKADYH